MNHCSDSIIPRDQQSCPLHYSELSNGEAVFHSPEKEMRALVAGKPKTN